MRIGFGTDEHPLVDGRPLIIGGVSIPFEKGLKGHSDADVLIHAIIDALLGAAGQGDIGKHFPDSDPKWKNASGLKMLSQISLILSENSVKITNIDCVILALKPAMTPHIPEMISGICAILDISSDRINIKAKSQNGLGDVGRGVSMAAQAVCLLEKSQ